VARSRTAQPAPVVVESDFSKGIIRDSPRVSIPNGGVYDSTDFLLHQPGLAQKRGGTSYPGPALTAATYAAAVKYAEFPAGAKLVAVGDNGHLYTVTSGATTDVSALGATYVPLDVPKLRVGSGKNLLIITANDGTTAPRRTPAPPSPRWAAHPRPGNTRRSTRPGSSSRTRPRTRTACSSHRPPTSNQRGTPQTATSTPTTRSPGSRRCTTRC
jgi:hypothetical protein